MSFESLLSLELTLVRTGSAQRDAIGGSAPADEETQTVMGYLEPVTSLSREDMENRNTQIGDWIAVLPKDTDVGGWDRIRYGGREFDIKGPPAPMIDAPSGAVHHLELTIREVKP